MVIVPRESVTTTQLIHRADRGARSWWHSATVCDLPGAFGDHNLRQVRALLPDIRGAGFSAILLRLAVADTAQLIDALSGLVESAHDSGLKVVVRVGGAEAGVLLGPTDPSPHLGLDADPAVLIERTRQLVDIGVDGVDLGLIDDDPDDPDSPRLAELFSQTVSRQLAELADAETTAILTAEAIRTGNTFFERHVTEDWFHHLRDDALFHSPWDAAELASRVRSAFSIRDPLGQVVAWRPSRGADWVPGAGPAADLIDSWADNRIPDQRFNAMMAFVAALPGALYLPFQQCGGSLREEGAQLQLSLANNPHDRFQFDLTRRILHLREEYQLATATLAEVSGLDWCPADALVHLVGGIVVVLNTSDEEIHVPSEHSPLLYSDGFLSTTDSCTVMGPDTCAWFVPAQTEVVDPVQYR